MSSQYNCDYCNNLVYDEEIEGYVRALHLPLFLQNTSVAATCALAFEGYVCDVDMDEDDYARLLSSSYKQCPYYQSNDEYKIVRHQM